MLDVVCVHFAMDNTNCMCECVLVVVTEPLARFVCIGSSKAVSRIDDAATIIIDILSGTQEKMCNAFLCVCRHLRADNFDESLCDKQRSQFILAGSFILSLRPFV